MLKNPSPMPRPLLSMGHDKVGNEAEAHVRFQELQHAYAVLSDPQERRWYDDHRDEILHPERYGGGDGDSDDEGGRGMTVNLTKYFRCNGRRVRHGRVIDPPSKASATQGAISSTRSAWIRRMGRRLAYLWNSPFAKSSRCRDEMNVRRRWSRPLKAMNAKCLRFDAGGVPLPGEVCWCPLPNILKTL